MRSFYTPFSRKPQYYSQVQQPVFRILFYFDPREGLGPLCAAKTMLKLHDTLSEKVDLLHKGWEMIEFEESF